MEASITLFNDMPFEVLPDSMIFSPVDGLNIIMFIPELGPSLTHLLAGWTTLEVPTGTKIVLASNSKQEVIYRTNENYDHEYYKLASVVFYLKALVKIREQLRKGDDGIE